MFEEIPSFHLHYEVQVGIMPKTSDSDDFSISIVQHYEGKSKRVDTSISISGYELWDRERKYGTKQIENLTSILYEKLADAFQISIKHISDNWDKLPDLQRMDYQNVKNIIYLPIDERCSECETTLCKDCAKELIEK